VGRHLGVGPICLRLVATSQGDPGLRVVGHQDGGRPAEVLERARVCPDPNGGRV
jgi:hypothetical protein